MEGTVQWLYKRKWPYARKYTLHLRARSCVCNAHSLITVWWTEYLTFGVLSSLFPLPPHRPFPVVGEGLSQTTRWCSHLATERMVGFLPVDVRLAFSFSSSVGDLRELARTPVAVAVVLRHDFFLKQNTHEMPLGRW